MIISMSSVLMYNMENHKNKERTLKEKVCPKCMLVPVILGSEHGRTESQTVWPARCFCRWYHAAAEAAWFRALGSRSGRPASTYSNTHICMITMIQCSEHLQKNRWLFDTLTHRHMDISSGMWHQDISSMSFKSWTHSESQWKVFTWMSTWF